MRLNYKTRRVKMKHKINLDINTRAWTLSVMDDVGVYQDVDVADDMVSDIINEYIKDMEEITS
tara:strand:- start:720 stop:908 length:189 start_codon:yes stop_codon:yes gene_type:complete